jgi:hypothetical protein
MSLNCTRCNPEAESQTFDARKRNRAFEALENAFEVVRHQADALILDPDERNRSAGPHADLNKLP